MFPLKIRRFANVSPKTAPLEWPMCIGPVGFAETNSILYFSDFFLLEPY